MKTPLFISLIAVLAVGCKPADKPNLASEVVLTAEPEAKCTALHTGAGSDSMHSVVCKLPSKAVLICSLSADREFACRSVGGPAAGTPPPASPQAQPPTQAPAN